MFTYGDENMPVSDFTKRQLEIIDSAIELIAARGIQSLTIKNLASQVGVTEGALYRHFRSKQEILLAILDVFGHSNAEVFEEIRKSEASPLKQLERVFTDHFRKFESKPALAAVIFSEEIFQNDSLLAETMVRVVQNSLSEVQKIVEAGQKVGEIRTDVPSEQLALVLLGSLRFQVVRWHLSGYGFSLQTAGARLWRTLRSMVVAPNEDVQSKQATHEARNL